MSEAAKARARKRTAEAVRAAKGFYWEPTPKKGDVVTDGTNTIVVQDVQWKKPIKVKPDNWRADCVHFTLSTPHAKQRNVSLTGSHLGRYAQAPVEPKRNKPENPSGP